MVRPKLILQVGAVCVVGLLLALLGWRVATRAEGQNVASSALKGKRPQAPDFELPLLAEERTLKLSSLRGKAVVLNFWASWCYPCRDEAPLLQSAWEKWRDEGVVVLGVDNRDFTGDARRFLREYGVTYPSVRDGTWETMDRFGIPFLPETMFLNREGKIVAYVQGPVEADDLGENIALALRP